MQAARAQEQQHQPRGPHNAHQQHRKLILWGNSQSAGHELRSAGKELPPSLISLQSNAHYKQRAEAWERGPEGEVLPSSKFAPWRISVCAEGMPKHWAPCIRIPHVDILYAEEVVYPVHKVGARCITLCTAHCITSWVQHTRWGCPRRPTE